METLILRCPAIKLVWVMCYLSWTDAPRPWIRSAEVRGVGVGGTLLGEWKHNNNKKNVIYPVTSNQPSIPDQISSDFQVSCLIYKKHYSNCNCPELSFSALKGYQQTFFRWNPLRIGTPEISIENILKLNSLSFRCSMMCK